jgi:hypothetical protein
VQALEFLAGAASGVETPMVLVLPEGGSTCSQRQVSSPVSSAHCS